MISLLHKLTHLLLALVLSVFVTSCQDTLPTRATIDPNRLIKQPHEPCPDGYELIEEDPADALEGQEPGMVCKLLPVERPTGAIFFKGDHCACKDGKPISYGNCASFCAGKNTSGAERLYANFTVGPEIALTTGLGSVHGWCTALLPGDEVNPACKLEAKSEDGTFLVDVNVLPGTNSITANIQDALLYDKTYILTLVETGSGARSNSIQLVKFSPDIPQPILGPLKNAPISQHACLIRSASEDDVLGDIYFTDAYRIHFYFLPRNPPPAIPGEFATSIACHDFLNPLYGRIDSETYPRLETRPGVFNVWDNTDPRFYDNNGNGTMDVDDIIIQKTKNFGGNLPAGANFFREFKLEGVEKILKDATGDQSYVTLPLGYIMNPWIDTQTYKSYCLNSSHYNSNIPLFKALRDVIGVETEGIYAGYKAAENIENPDGTVTSGAPDMILIRETDLKAVWFYFNNGVPTVPTDDDVTNLAVYFYYPLNKESPFVRTSTQRLYRVKGGNEVNGGQLPPSGGGTDSGGLSQLPPHDRKIGCVPKF